MKAIIALGVPSDFDKIGYYAFGKDGGLPWATIPEDMQSFQKKTDGSVCVMGAATYESLPFNLPNRGMIVVGYPGRGIPRARNGDVPDRCCTSLEAAKELADKFWPGKEICVIGGLNLVLSNFNAFDEIHINFLMLKADYDTISPDVYLLDDRLMELLSDRKLVESGLIHTDVDHCEAIKAGIWK